MKNNNIGYIIIVAFFVAYGSLFSQVKTTFENRSIELSNKYEWINCSKYNNDIFILGKNENQIAIYSKKQNRNKNVLLNKKGNNYKIENDVIIEWNNKNAIIYNTEGIVRRNATIPQDEAVSIVNIYYNEHNNKLYFGFYSHSANRKPGGLLEEKGALPLQEFGEVGGAEFVFPKIYFAGNYYICIDVVNYIFRYYDYNNMPLKTLDNSRYLQYHNSNIIKYKTQSEFAEEIAVRPIAIHKITEDGNKIIVVRHKQKKDNWYSLDYYDEGNMSFKHSVTIACNNTDIIRDVVVEEDLITVLIKNGYRYYLKTYSIK